tara:strand:- start:10 stop:657 length:648 start_codon:yes stop_codon:yes gene_type:complete
MKHLLSILLICSIGFTQELTVDGNLNVTGNIIFSDSTFQSTAPPLMPAFNGMHIGSGTLIIPENIIKIYVRMIGGGGGGGSFYQGVSGTDGQDGTFAMGVIDVTPGQILTIVNGNGGNGGSFSNGFAENGQCGEDSKITDNTGNIIALASGGSGGSLGSGSNITCPENHGSSIIYNGYIGNNFLGFGDGYGDSGLGGGYNSGGSSGTAGLVFILY